MCRTALLVPLLVSCWAVVAKADCPSSLISCGTAIYTTALRDSAHCVKYDGSYSDVLVDHRIGLASTSGIGGDGGAGGTVRALDEFQVIGPAPGTPLTVTATLRVHLSYSTSWAYWRQASAEASIVHGSLSAATSIRMACSAYDPCPVCCDQRDTDLTLPIPVLAGQPFSLDYGVSVYGVIASLRATGRLSFTGLPPGASVVSCKEFRQDVPTPTRRVSWGRAKVLYR